MIDIGVNLTNDRFDSDRDDLINRAKEAGVDAMLVTGTSVNESRNALALCRRYPHYLYATAGIHPHDADQAEQDFIVQLTQLAEHDCVKAIGECGLDFNRNFSTPENQVRIFKSQISLAAQLSMPLFLHQRDAFEPWFALLKPFLDKVPAMVSHCFTGSREELMQCLDAGMYIGITGWVCDERRGQALADVVKYIPPERLMIETDAPYLTPRNIRPRPKSSRNEPAYLTHVVRRLAETMPLTEQEIIMHSRQNSIRVFGMG